MTFWLTADFSVATAEVRRHWNVLQNIKRKLPSTPNSVKQHFKGERKTKTFSDKQCKN